MAFELKRDWPIVAAVLVGLLGLLLLLRGGREEESNVPVVTGATAAETGLAQAALQAEAGLQQTRLQTFGQLFSSFVGAIVAREQTQAQVEIAGIQAEAATTQAALAAQVAQAQVHAQLAAAQAQAAAQSQASLFGLIGTLAGIFFCFDVTDAAVRRRRGLATSWRDVRIEQFAPGEPGALPVARDGGGSVLALTG